MLKTFVSGPATGPSVLFLHGGGTTSNLWREVLSDTRAIRAVCVDMPGHGDSNQIAWVDFPTTAALIEQAAFDALGAHPQHLVGLSLGGYVAAELMQRQPDRYESVVITGIHDGVMPNRWIMRPLSKVTGRGVQYRWFAGVAARALGLKDDVKARFIDDTVRTSPDAVPLFLDQVCDIEGIAGLEHYRGRALYMAGAREHGFMRAATIRMAKRTPDAIAAIVPKRGHAWPGEDANLAARTFEAHALGEPLPRELDLMTATTNWQKSDATVSSPPRRGRPRNHSGLSDPAH